MKKRSNVGPALFGISSALMMTLNMALGACVSEGEKMGQEERIQNAYRGLGGKRTFYDGMITCSTLSGRAVCRLAGDLSCTAARRDLLRLLLCDGAKPPHRLDNPQAVCAKGLFHPAL